MEGEALRQHILDEATSLFARQGFRGISMRTIAEAAGLSKAGLYYHFRDKEDLFLSILTQSLDRMEPLVHAAQEHPGSAPERINVFVSQLLALSLRERAVIRLASQEMIHISLNARKAFLPIYERRFLHPLCTIFSEAQARGEMQPIAPQLATMMLLGMCFPFLCQDPDLEWEQLPQLGPTELAKTLVGTLWQGLRI